MAQGPLGIGVADGMAGQDRRDRAGLHVGGQAGKKGGN